MIGRIPVAQQRGESLPQQLYRLPPEARQPTVEHETHQSDYRLLIRPQHEVRLHGQLLKPLERRAVDLAAHHHHHLLRQLDVRLEAHIISRTAFEHESEICDNRTT